MPLGTGAPFTTKCSDGQLVQLLQEGKINAGQYHIPYQSKELNGVYIIVLQTTNQVITQKMISLK